MRILYFAFLRDRLGRGEEAVAPPPAVRTVADLTAWLAGLDEAHARVFADPAVVRAAVNQEFAGPGHAVADGDEVAFFPPVTGG